MCFDISSTKIKKLFEKNSGANFVLDFDYKPYYHSTGFLYPTVSIIKTGEPKSIYPATWGLIPEWGQNNIQNFRKKYNTLNAKSENLLTSKMYKENAEDNRCIILVDGFFEPHKWYDQTIPYYFYQPTNEFKDGRDIFAFAGIYNEFNNKFSCSLITTKANDFFSEIHNVKKRMPLVLKEDLIGEWLSTNLSNNQISSILNKGFTDKKFKAHSISKSFYNKGINSNKASIIEKVTYNTLFD
jgi:putative SOS response-associated peptidase YedK